MKKITINFLLVMVSSICSSQTINQYLNGIWKMECCDPDYIISYENKVYWINEKNFNNVKEPILNYCIPKYPTYILDESNHKIFNKSVLIDSVYFDRPFVLNDLGQEVFYLLEYTKSDIINKKEIKINDIGSNLNYYYINPKETNKYYVWDGGAPSKIVYYNRIISPPKYVLDFYKVLAYEKFTNIKTQKTTIYTSPNIPTKMYLVKGNEVEIIEEKDNWLKIRYYSKKSIEGWVKKEDVE